MTPRPKFNKQTVKPQLNRASIRKHAKILGKLGGRPKQENTTQSYIKGSYSTK